MFTKMGLVVGLVLWCSLVFLFIRLYNLRINYKVLEENDMENVFFKIEMKLKLLFENFDHRTDFNVYSCETVLESMKKSKMSLQIIDRLSPIPKTVRKSSYKIKAEIEKLYLLNRFKQKKVNEISAAIQARINRLQNEKCRIDNLVACTLVQEYCGFGCHLHTYSVAFLISYYWGKTLVLTTNKANGFQNFQSLFQPVARNCKFQNKSREFVIENSIDPFLVNGQVNLDPKHFIKFNEELHELSSYLSDPEAFVTGHFMSNILRFKEDTGFYKTLQKSKLNFNIPRPYVGVHIRRSDKANEAKFWPAEEYMKYVEEFFEIYFLKYPELANTTQRAVYLASDEPGIFKILEKQYPAYKFYYNDSFTRINALYQSRSSAQGFESFLFDEYFLSNADHLVCTFTSNVCRLAYELMVQKSLDQHKLARSLDTHYYNFGQLAKNILILDHDGGSFKLKKGTLLIKEVYYNSVYATYNRNGTLTAHLLENKQFLTVPSYKTKSYY